MLRQPLCTIFVLALFALVPRATLPASTAQVDSEISALLSANQYNVEGQGRGFLLDEAVHNDFFLLGELHGDNEIPALLKVLWPEMWKLGYRHIAAELSPWAAHQLEFVPAGQGHEVRGLWTKPEASAARAFADAKTPVLWGCDMEEEQPQFLIQALGTLNRTDPSITKMLELTESGYDRKMAPTLLALAERSKATKDQVVNDVSLRENLLATLTIETNRLTQETKMIAQNERERLMKGQFLQHYRRDSQTRAAKVLLRFGRNHLHRGYDARGISTLGNFISEFAVAEGKKAFNVGAFGTGGKASLLGNTWNADERNDELAFAFLAEKAKYPATLFDLRPLRPLMHQVPEEKRSALQANLTYWVDAYDALICYKNVTPLSVQRSYSTPAQN